MKWETFQQTADRKLVSTHHPIPAARGALAYSEQVGSEGQAGPRSLSDIDLSTTANDPRPSVSFSARKTSTYSSEYASGFSRPAASHLAAPPWPRHERQCWTGS